MSTGEFCLTCRRYINAVDKHWRCQCKIPVTSKDRKHPVDEAFEKIWEEMENEPTVEGE